MKKNLWLMAAIVAFAAAAGAQSGRNSNPQTAKPQACSVATTANTSTDGGPGTLRADGSSAPAEIQSAVQRECASFSSEQALRNVRLKVSDNNIIISGSVPTEQDEQRLLTIAQANADGRVIFNRLDVGNASTSIAANTSSGGVTGSMIGQAPATATSRDSGAIGTAADGAAPSTAAPTRDLREQIQLALRSEPLLSDQRILVSVTKDEVVLTGAVRGKDEKRTATRIAKSHAGKRRVVDHMQARDQ